MSKIIHDNLWGDIAVDPLAIAVIDTPEFQRLHHINQTGCAFKVFPTAKTSRFEHSLGTYHIASVLLDHLLKVQPDLGDVKVHLIRLAALCHDIGHGPFSHCYDHAFPDGEHHEKRSVVLTQRLLGRVTPLTEDDITYVCMLIDPPEGGPWHTTLVKNKTHGIDVDKLDYIPRDNNAFGLTLNVDVNRIISNTRVINDELCFCDRIKDDIFNFFYVRYRLHREVYCHPKILAFDLLLRDILRSHTCAIQDWTDMQVLILCPNQDLVRMFMSREAGYRLHHEGDVCVTIRPAFSSVSGHPLAGVTVYSRKSMVPRRLSLTDYSMLATGPYVEEITHHFVSPDT